MFTSLEIARLATSAKRYCRFVRFFCRLGQSAHCEQLVDDSTSVVERNKMHFVNSLFGSTAVVELRKVHMVNSLVGSTTVVELNKVHMVNSLWAARLL